MDEMIAETCTSSSMTISQRCCHILNNFQSAKAVAFSASTICYREAPTSLGSNDYCPNENAVWAHHHGEGLFTSLMRTE